MRSLLLALVACFLSIGAQAKATNLRLLLSGPIGFQWAGYYVALEKGFYRDAGINLSIITSNQSRGELIERVVSQNVELAIGNSSLAYAALEGKPVTVLANIFQRTSGVLIAKPDFGNQLFLVRDPHLNLPTPMEAPGVYAFLMSQGVAFADTLRANPKDNTLGDFIANRAPVVYGQLYFDPLILAAKNIPFKLLDPVQYGIHFYGDTLFAHSEWVRNHSEEAQQLVAATIKGWEYALAHRAEAIDILMRQSGGTSSAAFLSEQARVIEDLIMPSAIAMGRVDPDRWYFIANFFKRTGLVKANAQLPASFLNLPNDPRASANYRLMLEIVAGLLGLLLLVAIYWFYPRLRYWQRSYREQEVLFHDAQKKANLDPLTGLPNRRLLIERLREAVAHCQATGEVFALCFLDIDNFKVINDQHGHIVGDEILVQLARRIQAHLKPRETLSRQGGDEFVLILYEVISHEEVAQKMDALRAIIREPLQVGEASFAISVSFGYALYQTDSDTIEDLLKAADRRMYREKFKNLGLAQE